MAEIEQTVATAWKYRDKRQQAAFSGHCEKLLARENSLRLGSRLCGMEVLINIEKHTAAAIFTRLKLGIIMCLATSRDSEIAWLVLARDDGRFAVIELVARSRSAFSAAL